MLLPIVEANAMPIAIVMAINTMETQAVNDYVVARKLLELELLGNLQFELLNTYRQNFQKVLKLAREPEILAETQKLLKKGNRNFEAIIRVNPNLEIHLQSCRLPIFSYFFFKTGDFELAENYMQNAIKNEIKLIPFLPLLSHRLQEFRLNLIKIYLCWGETDRINVQLEHLEHFLFTTKIETERYPYLGRTKSLIFNRLSTFQIDFNLQIDSKYYPELGNLRKTKSLELSD